MDYELSILSYTVCPKCQSEMRWSQHFGILKSEKSPLFGGIMLDRAKICLKCGYIEFYLDSENVKKLKKIEFNSDEV